MLVASIIKKYFYTRNNFICLKCNSFCLWSINLYLIVTPCSLAILFFCWFCLLTEKILQLRKWNHIFLLILIHQECSLFLQQLISWHFLVFLQGIASKTDSDMYLKTICSFSILKMKYVLHSIYSYYWLSIICSILGSPFWQHVKEILNPETSVGARPWVYYTIYAFFVFLFNIFDIVSILYTLLFTITLGVNDSYFVEHFVIIVFPFSCFLLFHLAIVS